MEMQGALEALRSLAEPTSVQLYSDSRYLVDGMNRWVGKWKRNGWQTKRHEAVKNIDIWQALDVAAKPHRVEWCWIKGHVGQPENEECDRIANEMAVQARQESIASTYIVRRKAEDERAQGIHAELDRELSDRLAREA